MVTRRSLGGNYGSVPIGGGESPAGGPPPGGPPPGGGRRRLAGGGGDMGQPTPLPAPGPSMTQSPMGALNPQNVGAFTGGRPTLGQGQPAGVDPRVQQLLKSIMGGV